MSMPNLDLPIVRWEIKEIFEKDDDFNVILKDGKPIVADSWVILYVSVGGVEVAMEVEREPFEKRLLPLFLEPTVNYWRTMKPDHPLFPLRAATLAQLLK